jgi:ABC transporter substrate-binding protein PnrA-like
MGDLVRRRWLWAGVAAVLVVAGLVTWLAWPSAPEPPRARPYLEYTACLLTDAQGVAGPVAKPVWDGMEEASLATHAKVQNQQVVGEATVGNALPYLNGMLQRRCAVVVAVGAAQIEAVGTVAQRYPEVRFIVVGAGAPGKNVTAVTGLSGDPLRDRVRDLVADIVHAAAPR